MIFNKHYLKTYKRYRDILSIEVILILKKLPSQSEAPIFKINAVANKNIFINHNDTESQSSSITLFIDELKELMSINLDNAYKFPIREIQKRIETIRFNDMNYTIDGRNINIFDNTIKFALTSNL